MKLKERSAVHGLVLALLTALPAPLAAQDASAPSSRDLARTHLEAGARLTSLRSQGAVLLGGSARFGLGGPLTFGAGGWVLTNTVDVTAGEPGTGLLLNVAYGGVVTGWDLVEAPRFRSSARILWGAGNAALELPAVKTEIASDNFLVVEPALATALRLHGPLRLLGELTYRWVGSVNDLPGITAGQLRGFSASLGLAVGPL